MNIDSAGRQESRKYRPEIDGIRAFAVIAVLINHFNEGFLPGGYLGVDVFFVISGYVITSSLSARSSEAFSEFIGAFYARRIKRLVPALLAFVLAVSILLCLFDPSPGSSLSTGALSLFGLSNIHLFAQSIDYFGQSSELNPFTHSWSLGVEEQFYIVFPLIVWFSGFSRQFAGSGQRLFKILLPLSVASMIGFLYLYDINQPAAYFLMPTRFWEMAAGCLLFIGFQERAAIERQLEKVPPILILFSMTWIMFQDTSLKAIATIGIVLLTAFLIASLKRKTLAYRFFVCRSIVYLGLISYPLYLWHWGVLVLLRLTVGVSIYTFPLYILCAVVPAIVSYEFIEKRFRRAAWSSTSLGTIGKGIGALLLSAGALMALKGVGSEYLFAGETLRFRNKSQTAAKAYIGEFSNRNAQDCQNIIDGRYGPEELLNKCSTGTPPSSVTNKFLVFIGDSHSGMLMPLSEQLFYRDNVMTVDLFNDGCTIPQLDIASGRCLHMNQAILGMAKKYKAKVTFVVSSNFIGPDNFIQDTIRIAEEVTSHGSNLIIMAPNPVYPGLIDGGAVDKSICQIQWFRPTFALGEDCSNGFRINRRDNLFNKERVYYVSRLRDYASQNQRFFVYDLFEHLCFRDTPLDKSCSPYKDAELVYYDDNHINIYGAKILYPSFKSFLKLNGLAGFGLR